jgi:flavin-dependent dehydrogenase
MFRRTSLSEPCLRLQRGFLLIVPALALYFWRSGIFYRLKNNTLVTHIDSEFNKAGPSQSYGVAVIGAGPAGLCAAADAGRSASVILIDGADRIGGSVTAAMHRSICGLYSRAPASAPDTLNASAQRRIVELMLQKDPTSAQPRQFGKAWVLEIIGSVWERSLLDFCFDSNPNVRLQMETRVTGVRREGARIAGIKVENPTAHWIETKAVVDCTGAGNVLRLAGEDAYL